MERIVNEEPVGRGAERERPGRAPVHRETVVPIAHEMDDLALPAELVVSPAAVTRTFGAVVLALVVALVVAGVYLRFLVHLPARSRRLFVIAGLLSVGGAVGLESVSGKAQELFGRGSAPLALASTLEETAEMVGVLVFVYALLDYIQRAAPVLRLRFASSTRPITAR